VRVAAHPALTFLFFFPPLKRCVTQHWRGSKLRRGLSQARGAVAIRPVAWRRSPWRGCTPQRASGGGARWVGIPPAIVTRSRTPSETELPWERQIPGARRVPVPGEGPAAGSAAVPRSLLRVGGLQPSVPLYLGQPARPCRERNRFVEAAVIFRIRKGLEPLRQAGGDVCSPPLPDFSALPVWHSPGFRMQNLPWNCLAGKPFFFFNFNFNLFSFLLSLQERWEPSGALTFRNWFGSKANSLGGAEFCKNPALGRAWPWSQRVVSPAGSRSPRSQAQLKVRAWWARSRQGRAGLDQEGTRTGQGQAQPGSGRESRAGFRIGHQRMRAGRNGAAIDGRNHWGFTVCASPPPAPALSQAVSVRLEQAKSSPSTHLSLFKTTWKWVRGEESRFSAGSSVSHHSSACSLVKPEHEEQTALAASAASPGEAAGETKPALCSAGAPRPYPHPVFLPGAPANSRSV